jgi:stage II sporulation protein D
MNILKFIKTLTITVLFVLISSPVYAFKVGLLTNAGNAYVATSKLGSIVDGNTGKTIMTVNPMQVYYIKPNGSSLTVNASGHISNLGSNYVVVKSFDNGYVFSKRRWYRGDLILLNKGKGVTVINQVDLETYIRGVVPSEMPSSWNTEAHKAQAIAARSYAVANLGKRARFGYDLKDTPEDQAYGGASSETMKTNVAVIQTKGQVLVCGNKVIPAYYHSSSGGYTINSGSVWFKDLPFVRSVPSFDGNLPKRGHGIGMSQHGANVLANYGYNAYQILGYFYQNVKLYSLNVDL